MQISQLLLRGCFLTDLSRSCVICRVPACGKGFEALLSESLLEYMEDSRSLVLAELSRFVPNGGRYRPILYDLVFDYPLRNAKALRPALCIATCRALGGQLEAVTTSAAVLELYHNAFLVHDDVEDGSERRRGGPTLHRVHGVPVAVNVGDAMLAIALEPLLDNMRLLTLGKALRILQAVARMARESVEGQAVELAWIRAGTWAVTDRDYRRMVHKKTSHYSFIAPMLIGGIVGDADAARLSQLSLFAILLGAAFQIQDDILNLSGEEGRVGKEVDGDLWEGKHTLILLHAMRSSTSSEHERAVAILRKPRPQGRSDHDRMLEVGELVERLERDGRIESSAAHELRLAVDGAVGTSGEKTVEDVEFLKDLINRYDSIAHARRIAARWAGRARSSLDQMRWLRASVHRDFLRGLTDFVVERDH